MSKVPKKILKNQKDPEIGALISPWTKPRIYICSKNYLKAVIGNKNDPKDLDLVMDDCYIQINEIVEVSSKVTGNFSANRVKYRIFFVQT